MFASAGGAHGHPPPVFFLTLNTSEQVYISSLALLKMLNHGTAGGPMEVMGLMLGEFILIYIYIFLKLGTVADKEGIGAAVLISDVAFVGGLTNIQQRHGQITNKPVLARPGKQFQTSLQMPNEQNCKKLAGSLLVSTGTVALLVS